MDIYLKRIIEEENDNDRFMYLDCLLSNKWLDIKVLEDYYIENISRDSISFAEKYYNIVNIERIEDAIIKSKSSLVAYWICEFARKVKGANISKLEDTVIKSGDAYHIYEFARDIKGANITRLEDAIIKTKKIILFVCLLKMLKMQI